MPIRTKNTYSTAKGTYNFRKKTFTGKGPAPSGSRKVREPTAATAPTVTTSSTGEITTSGYRTRQASTRARRRARSAQRRVRRITQATEVTRRSATRRRQASQRSEASVRRTEAAVKAASAELRATERPARFEGRKTAGTPTRSSLLRAKRTGTLKVNRKGFLTTPPVRKTAKTIKRLESKRLGSTGSLPGLTAPQSKVARTVLRRGERVGATRKEKLAAIETGLVESGFENLGYGDADSEGWRQERTSIYGTGPAGPRNVKRSADRFFGEIRTDPGAATAPTAGAAAQAAQGSAYPERYDERAPEAKAILRAHNKGNLPPKQQRKLKKARRKAAELGLTKLAKKAPKKAKRGVPSVVYIGHQAEKKFGLTVGENPAFGGVDPVHTEGSYHYQRDRKKRGKAIDVTGPPEKLLAFDEWVADKWGEGITELFYDPGISIKEGAEIGPIGGHGTHVHVAQAMPGQSFEGGFTAGPSGAVFVGYGSSPAAAAVSAANAARAAGRGKARKVSPWKRYWNVMQRLEQAGVGTGQPESKESASATLGALERKYGVKV